MSREVLLEAILANAMALAQWMGGAMLVISNVPAALGEMALNQHGLTGSWYQPATNGEGIKLEVYRNAVAPDRRCACSKRGLRLLGPLVRPGHGPDATGCR